MKFAAIDIGSNATRLLFCNVISQNGKSPVFKKAELIRVPLRLGEDSFIRGRIGKDKADKLVTAMQAFKYLIKVYDAIDYRACATSAMRDAENRWDIVDRIRKETGIRIEIIDGKTEADIIYANHIEKYLENGQSYLYIDIGGGSTEITLFSNGKVVASQSFNVGTIRMLHEQIDKEYWAYFKKWVREICEGKGPVTAIGSGGNINKLFKMTRKKESKPLPVSRIREVCEMVESYAYEDRVRVLGLNPDRADVIVPASKILLSVLKQSQAEKIIVPQFGLSDGIVHQLYDKYRQKQVHRLEA
ncbi:MAG: ethanolamine ammonia-lyase reactivating factor EutA [Bacteroidia bacterium]|nr:ethanolamine ammonia-lyase reactivating factor EutA [Bacteroidia bacterium]